MHDNIKQTAIYPVLDEYVQTVEHTTEYVAKTVRIDELAGDLTVDLIKQCFGRWFLHYLDNILVGLIRTVAYVSPVFNIPSIAGYILIVLMGAFCYKKERFGKAVSFLLLTALLTAGNVSAVAMTIMSLSRYMIYNTAFVYISAVLLLVSIIEDRRTPQPEYRTTKRDE